MTTEQPLTPISQRWKTLGALACKQKQYPAALIYTRRALALDPSDVEARVNLAAILQTLDDFEGAEKELCLALEHDPNDWRALFHLGHGDYTTNRASLAILAFEKALKEVPEGDAKILVQGALANAYFKAGDFEGGYENLPGRWQTTSVSLPGSEVPEWQGDLRALQDRRILVWCVHGVGDVVMLSRFLPQLVGAGARVVMAAPKTTVRFLEGQTHLYHEVIGLDEEFNLTSDSEQLTGMDYHVPLAKLMSYLRVSYDQLPGVNFPYLHPDFSLTERVSMYDGNPGDLKVGIAWVASRASVTGPRRSIPFEAFLPLAEVPGVSLYGLEATGANTIRGAWANALVHDLSHAIHDVADLASLMGRMDAVVSTDTAPLHLAGAMGIPCMGLLSRAYADWRWFGNDRTDSPWYPSMRVFRQTRADDWEGPVGRAADFLAELVKTRGSLAA
jgi:hypothetical protein